MTTYPAQLEQTTAFALEEKSKLIKSLRRFDMVFFTVCAFVGLDTLGTVASNGPQGFAWLVILAAVFVLPYALLMARTARQRFGADWAVAETGATGPTGNRYGDAAGHTCIAICGTTERALTLETGSHDRVGNMRAFSAAALDLLAQSLAAA